MSTLAEIEAAVEQLPPLQQAQLLNRLANRVRRAAKVRPEARRTLKAAAYPPLEGLPADLSVDTREKALALVFERGRAAV